MTFHTVIRRPPDSPFFLTKFMIQGHPSTKNSTKKGEKMSKNTIVKIHDIGKLQPQ